MKNSKLKTTEFVCENGICLYAAPLAVSESYPLICGNGNTSELVEVGISDKPTIGDDKKHSSKRLKIRAKLSFANLMQASVDLDYEKIGDAKAKVIKKVKLKRR